MTRGPSRRRSVDSVAFLFILICFSTLLRMKSKNEKHEYVIYSEADLGFFRSRGHNGATIYREGPSLPFKSLETLTITA